MRMEAVLVVRESSDEGSIEVFGSEFAMLFDTQACRFGNAVKAQVVFFFIEFRQQPTFQFLKLHFVNLTFKYRFLHTLTDAFTNLRDAPQALSTGARFG